MGILDEVSFDEAVVNLLNSIALSLDRMAEGEEKRLELLEGVKCDLYNIELCLQDIVKAIENLQSEDLFEV